MWFKTMGNEIIKGTITQEEFASQIINFAPLDL